MSFLEDRKKSTRELEALERVCMSKEWQPLCRTVRFSYMEAEAIIECESTVVQLL